MENLNAEQVKKALECCTRGRKSNEDRPCLGCPYNECNLVGGTSERQITGTCQGWLMKDALALITLQEQRIGAQDMTISELRKRVEKAEHDADRYAQRIKELTVDLEAMRGAANSYKMHNKELTEENEAWQKRLIATEEKADKAYYELACEVENLRTESDKLTEENGWLEDNLIKQSAENVMLVGENKRLKARSVEALTEFAESVKRYYSALPGATVGAAVRFYVDEKLKEALDKI